MGRLRLILRLAARDLRRRRAEAVLLLLAFTAATTTLGLALHGVTSHPYERTRAATNGPDAVVRLNATHPSHVLTDDDLGMLTAVAKRSGAAARSGHSARAPRTSPRPWSQPKRSPYSSATCSDSPAGSCCTPRCDTAEP